MKLNALLEIENNVQKQWHEKNIFHEDAPEVPYYTIDLLISNLLLLNKAKQIVYWQ